MNPIDTELNREWVAGCQLDLDYQIPRIVYYIKDPRGYGKSVCYIYEYGDIDEHVKTGCLGNLEQLELRLFYREHCVELLKKRIAERVQFVSKTVTPIFRQYTTERGSINTYKSTRR